MAEPASVDDLKPGDHACLTFTDADERVDIVAAFVRDGLKLGQKVVCYTDMLSPPDLAAELGGRGLPVREAVADGQFEVVASGDVFVENGSFTAVRMIETLHGCIDAAERAGYPGVRIAADMCWAMRPVAGIHDLLAYEDGFSRLLADGRATAVCQYGRHGFDTVTLAGVSAVHTRALTAATYHHDPVLRICRQHVPPGLRLAGELDYRAVPALVKGLGEALQLDGHLFVNAARLTFLDVAGAGAILQTAAGSGSARMTVLCQPTVGKLLRALGADDVDRLRLVIRDVD